MSSAPDFLREDVRYLKGVGEKRADVLRSAAGVRTVRDLLRYYPRRYLDRQTVTPIRRLTEDGEAVTVMGEVRATGIVKGKRSKRLEVRITDGSGGSMKCVWFRGIWGLRKVFEKGDRVAFHGKPSRYGSRFSMSHPEFDKLSDDSAALDTGRIVALYPGSEALNKVGLTSRAFRRILFHVFKEHGLKLGELFPNWLTEAYNLMEGRVALRAIHFPKSQAELQRARRRLKFEELFFIQLLLARSRSAQRDVPGLRFGPPGGRVSRFLGEVLPFELTDAQKSALRDIVDDTQSGYQMNRLLQGDVGSGKTVVAVGAMLHALDSGHQSAFMAPTEILAEQHFANLQKYLGPLNVGVRLLIGSQAKSEREDALEALRTGEASVAVGTHAIIQKGVDFEQLGLAVVDEQHRFGVAQRAEMFSKGEQPHMLLMTATPIPRSLAMTLYGDLDVSIMDEMPAGRKPVKTALRSEKRRGEVYAFLNDHLEKGEQIYVVYPLVEESEKMDLKDATQGYEKLKEAFAPFEVGLVHGQMPASEKEDVMQRFKGGDVQMLVSTTVIEVGVDVPEATVMLIEHAERFGLSQLHQLRGRVGRSDQQSWCILMAAYKRSAEAKERLKAMVDTNDGFEISERDLQIRGAGDFFGTRQSGMPDLKIADITQDEDVLEEARAGAFALMERDPSLENAEHERLREHFERYYAKRKLGYARVG